MSRFPKQLTTKTSEAHYLIKVLGVSGVPKLATFALSLTTIPIVLRNVGAVQYGTYLYVVAALAICEVLIDFGVSAAAGRRLAELRASYPGALRSDIFAWARLQAVFLAGGFVPMVLVAYLALSDGRTEISSTLLAVVAATLGLNVVLNFCRPCLQSMLAFKSLSVLDTGESVLRSLTQLAAAQFMASALGLAIAGLATSALAAALAVLLLLQGLREQGMPPNDAAPAMSLPDRLRASASFLLLRTSTRLFQEMPLILIGRMLGPELVGIIGAFRRVGEVITTPYLIIGNALMVRVNEIRARGQEAMASLWEAALRIVSTAVYLAVLCHLAAEALGAALLPGDVEAPQAFRMLAPLIFTASLIGVLAPMLDYLGAVARRSAVLTVMALLQVLLLWQSMGAWGAGGALGAYLVTNLLLAVTYFLLAQHIFFDSCWWMVRREVMGFSMCCVVALVLTRLTWLLPFELLQLPIPLSAGWFAIKSIVVFSLLFGLGLRARQDWWRYYLRPGFLDLTR